MRVDVLSCNFSRESVLVHAPLMALAAGAAFLSALAMLKYQSPLFFFEKRGVLPRTVFLMSSSFACTTVLISSRRVRNLVFKALFDVWFTRCSRGTVIADEFSSDNINGEAGYKSLKKREMMSSSAIELWNIHLETLSNELHPTSIFTMDITSAALPEVEKRYIHIPLALKGIWSNHAVEVFVDQAEKNLYYYDSTGLMLQDRGSQLLTARTNTTLAEFIQEVKKKYRLETSIDQSSKDQFDTHNCGLFVSLYPITHLKLDGHEEVELSTCWINTQGRQFMLKRIVNAE